MISLQLTLELDSPLHVGSETRQNTWADRPLLKDDAGRPYVPATSIKGRLRYEMELVTRHALISQGLDPDQGIVCQPPTRMCQPSLTGWNCPVCELFGSPWQESTLYFDDLVLGISETENLSLAAVRTGTRVNRRRRVVEDEFLFTTEMSTPGLPLSFSGQVRCRDSSLDLTPLYVAAQMAHQVGGVRSRGLGWCKLELEGSPEPHALAEDWLGWVQVLAERWRQYQAERPE